MNNLRASLANEEEDDFVTLHMGGEEDKSTSDESSTSTNSVGEGLGRFRRDPLGFMNRYRRVVGSPE